MKKLSLILLVFIATFAYADVADFIIPNRQNGGNVIIQPKDASGTKKTMITADPDAEQISFSYPVTGISSSLDPANGTNIIFGYNSDFEGGSTSNWTNSGGTLTATNTASEIGSGTYSGKFVATGSGQYFETVLRTVQNAMEGNSCSTQIKYNTANGSTWKIQVYDNAGTPNKLAEADLSATDGWLKSTPLAFTCPSDDPNDQIKVRVISSAAGTIYADDAWLGTQKNEIDLSQAEIYGELVWANDASCDSWDLSSTSYVDYPADGGCVVESTEGYASEPDTKIPGVKFNSLPPGKYEVIARGLFRAGASATKCGYRISDGTNAEGETFVQQDHDRSRNNIIATFTYEQAQSNITFKMQGKSVDGVLNCPVLANLYTGDQLTWIVKRFPLSSEKAVSLETQGMAYYGYFEENCAFGEITSSTYADFPGDSTCTLTENINRNIGTVTATLDGSNKILGIDWTPRRTGIYKVCNYQTTIVKGSIVGDVGVRLIDNSNVLDEWSLNKPDGSYQTIDSMCGLIDVTSLSTRTIKIQGKNSAGKITHFSLDNEDMVSSFVIYPITQNFPQAVAITDINPTYMSASAATKLGRYEYLWTHTENQTYNNGIEPSVSGPSGGTFRYYPYQLNDGSWRLKFTWSCSLSSSDIMTWTITGVDMVTSQSLVAWDSAASAETERAAVQASTQIKFHFTSAITGMYGHGDIKLNAKPTWAY